MKMRIEISSIVYIRTLISELGLIFSGPEVHFASSWLQVEISDQCFSEPETSPSKGSNHLGTSDSRTEFKHPRLMS